MPATTDVWFALNFVTEVYNSMNYGGVFRAGVSIDTVKIQWHYLGVLVVINEATASHAESTG